MKYWSGSFWMSLLLLLAHCQCNDQDVLDGILQEALSVIDGYNAEAAATMLASTAKESTAGSSSAAPAELDTEESQAVQNFLANCTINIPPGFFPGPLDPANKTANTSIYSPLGNYQYLQYNYNCQSSGTPIDEYWAAQQAINTPNTALDIWEAGRPNTTVSTPASLRATFAAMYPPFIVSFFWGFANTTENLFLAATSYPTKFPPGPGGGGLLNGYTLAVRYIPSLLTNFLAPFFRPFGIPKTTPFGSETFASVITFNISQPKYTAAFLFAPTRGNSLCEILTDVNYNSVGYTVPKGLKECSGCRVHQGFYAAFLTLLNPADPNNLYNSWVNVSGNEDPSTVKLVLCGGHSLGAAMSQLCALWAKAVFPNAVIQVWMSGAPRVGNPQWAEYWNSYITPENAPRLVDNRDPVPTLPFSVMPGLGISKIVRPVQHFRHVGQPFFMYRNGSRLPGVYWGYQQQRAPLYNDLNRITDQSFLPGGFWYDHVYGYTLGLLQLTQNCPPNQV